MAPDRYQVTPLPFIPFSDTGGEALSSSGAVVGGIVNADGSISVAQWFNGVLTNLGVPPGLPSTDFDRPRVFGVNGSGAIVGTVHTAAGDLPSRSFIYDRGRFAVLPLVAPANLGGAAIGINGRGEVVGYDRTPGNNAIGWLWSNGAYSALPVTGTDTAALGINSSGTIIGNRTLGLFRRVLAGQFRRTGQRGYVLSQGTAQYLKGFVYAINDLGEAAGGTGSDRHAVAAVFKNGVARVILNLPSYAVGINSSAHVVGFYKPTNSDRRRLFIWSAGSGALDLTPCGYRSAEAAAINDRGDVLGFGETDDAKKGYFLLTPDSHGALQAKGMITAPPAA